MVINNIVSRMKLFSSIIIIFTLLLLTTSLVHADNNICNNLKSKDFIKPGLQLPSFLPYSNEVMFVYVNGSPIGTLTIEDGKIKDIKCSQEGKATYNLYIKNERVIDDLLKSGNIDLLNDYLGNGNIDISGVTTSKKIKLFFTKILLKIGSWFM